MKLKARDIIKGWPRGHSTSQPHPFTVTLPLPYKTKTATEIHRVLDNSMNDHYHSRQEAMVDGYRQLWRIVAPPPTVSDDALRHYQLIPEMPKMPEEAFEYMQMINRIMYAASGAIPQPSECEQYPLTCIRCGDLGPLCEVGKDHAAWICEDCGGTKPTPSQPSTQSATEDNPKMYISMAHYREILQKCLDGERAMARVEAIEKEIMDLRNSAPEMPKPLVSDETIDVVVRFYGQSHQVFARNIVSGFDELHQWRKYGSSAAQEVRELKELLKEAMPLVKRGNCDWELYERIKAAGSSAARRQKEACDGV